jgi:drug/metabolite transporter (DMT)-like permease
MKNRQLHATTGGLLAITTLAVIFGLTAVLARYLGTETKLFEQWYLRYGIMFLLSIFVFHRRVNFRKFLALPGKEWLVILFRASIGSMLAVALYTLAAQQAKIGVVAFMQVLPSTALLGILLFHERVSKARAGAILLAFLGASLVVVQNLGDLANINIGALWSLISGILFSLQFVTRKWHSKALNNQELTVVIIGAGFIMNYIVSLVSYHRFFASTAGWDTQFVLVLFVAGCLGVVNIFLINYGFERVSAVIAGNILALEQVFGTLFGFILYREVLSAREVIGGAVILVAVILTNQLNKRENVKDALKPAPD